MSIRETTRVWDTAPYGAGTLLVLLALSDYADDNGICWPNIDSIASRARLSRRQTINVLNQLVKAGDLGRTSNRGRGQHNYYAILVGCTDEQKVQRLHLLDTKRCNLRHEKGAICDTKKVQSATSEKVPFLASEQPKTALFRGGSIMDPSCDPSERVSNETPPQGSEQIEQGELPIAGGERHTLIGVSGKKKEILSAAPPKPPRPPAVDVYRSVFQRYPAKAQQQLLARVERLDVWQHVCELWVLSGWKPTNLAGMLERYDRDLADVERTEARRRAEAEAQAERERETAARAQAPKLSDEERARQIAEAKERIRYGAAKAANKPFFFKPEFQYLAAEYAQ